MKKTIVLMLTCVFIQQGYSQLFKFTFDGQAQSPGQGNIVSVQNATITGVTRSGTPLAYAATDEVYNTSGWNLSSQGSQYLYVTVTADPGYKVSIQSFGFGAWSTYTGPSNGSVSIEKSGSSVYSNTFTPGKAATSGASAPSSLPPFPFDLSSSTVTSDINGSLTIKIFGWGSASGGNLRIDNFYVNGTVQPNSPLSIDYTNSKVGISTTTPEEKLDVNGNIKATGLIVATGGAADGYVLTSTNSTGTSAWRPAPTTLITAENGANVNSVSNKIELGGALTKNTDIPLGTNKLFFSGTDAQVAIGTNDVSKMTDGCKLYVAGNIKANKLTIKTWPWADFVFDSTYKLPTLTDVENFITQNKHLPNIPSANEVENNGIDVGTSQALLLQKIEELTLYIIKQNKEAETQKNKIIALEKQSNSIQQLQQQIDELKKLIIQKNN